ncbi:NADH-cytochrome b5 reductase 1-like [Bolinopsis microptera]|uniref:NADH-cytochrome b5 reductase 1-like n=1 Tax=Bolinopsis microptera TaxID=2820187 RepID=UPI00307A101B
MERLANAQVVGVTVALVGVVITMWCLSRKKKSYATLNKSDKVALTLLAKTIVSHDTRKFRFSLPSSDHILGLPVGSFINVSAILDGKLVVRPYTPITSDDEFGYMDLMIKVYKDGKMSTYMDSLSIGDEIKVRGPCGKIRYLGKGVFEVEKSRDNIIKLNCKRMGMIAGGSGITPMLQLIRDVVKNRNDNTEMTLLFSNKTENDILCRGALDEMCCPKFKICHTLSQAPIPKDWCYATGRVNKAMIEKYMPPPADDTVILLCGPPGLIKQACLPAFQALGYNQDNILAF